MEKSFGKSLETNTKIIEAFDVIIEEIEKRSQDITKIKPAVTSLKNSYKETLDRLSECRGGNLYYPYLSSGIGNGPLVELGDGSVKYDLICGIGVHYFGHSHLGLIKASLKAAIEDTVMQGNLQQNEATLSLSEKLLGIARKNGSNLQHVFLSTSGAMANENALKMIFQKNAPRDRILAFNRCFSGRTMAMAQITDKPANRVGLPETIAVDYVPFFDSKRPDESTEEAIGVVKKYLNQNKNCYAGMIFELIQGEGGYYPGSTHFFKSIAEFLRENDIAVWIDEIQTFARTEEPFAFQYYGLDAYVDLVTIGKMSQICATFFTEKYKPKPGLISQTFTASTSAIQAALFTMEYIERENLFGMEGKIKEIGNYFSEKLGQLSMKYPNDICGPFGVGGMVACTYQDGNLDSTKHFLNILFEEGVIGFLAGADPVRIRFLPPLPVFDKSNVDEVISIMEHSLVRAREKTS